MFLADRGNCAVGGYTIVGFHLQCFKYNLKLSFGIVELGLSAQPFFSRPAAGAPLETGSVKDFSIDVF